MRLTGTKSTTGIKGETYMRMNIAAALMAGTILVTLTGCSPALESATAATQITAPAEKKSETTTEKTAATRASEMTTQTEEITTVTEAAESMTLKIGERKVPVTWEERTSQVMTNRQRPRPEISFFMRGTAWWCSTDPIPGHIQDSERSTCPRTN